MFTPTARVYIFVSGLQYQAISGNAYGSSHNDTKQFVEKEFFGGPSVIKTHSRMVYTDSTSR